MGDRLVTVRGTRYSHPKGTWENDREVSGGEGRGRRDKGYNIEIRREERVNNIIQHSGA
jgi:hypothetical protein